MNILIPNNGKDVQYIISSNVYVKIWDYGKMHILAHLNFQHSKSSLSENIWSWINLTEGMSTDISESNYSSFDEAINRAINNPYCTVYQFENNEEMAENWSKIRYVDQITTVYKSKDNKNV